jgi:hypothetical protein
MFFNGNGCFFRGTFVLMFIAHTRGDIIVPGKKEKISTLEIRLWNSDHKNGKI